MNETLYVTCTPYIICRTLSYGMKYERLEVRLDKEHQSKVAELRATYGTTTSEAVRRAIDEAHLKMVEERRKRALERILAFEGIEDVPEPEELRRQLESTHDVPDPYRN